MTCALCGGTGYMPATQYGLGCGTSLNTAFGVIFGAIEPCPACRWLWSNWPRGARWPQPPAGRADLIGVQTREAVNG